MKKKRLLTLYILIAMVSGAAVGYGLHETVADKQIGADIAAHIAIATDVFLRLIKMIISLLVFSTLTVGIAHMGAGAAGGPGGGVRARRHRTGIAQGRGSIADVCAALGVPRQTLYYKMQKYGLTPDDYR